MDNLIWAAGFFESWPPRLSIAGIGSLISGYPREINAFLQRRNGGVEAYRGLAFKEFRPSALNSLSSNIVLDSARSTRYIPAYSTLGPKFPHRRQQVLQAHEDDVGGWGKFEGELSSRIDWMRRQGSPLQAYHRERGPAEEAELQIMP